MRTSTVSFAVVALAAAASAGSLRGDLDDVHEGFRSRGLTLNHNGTYHVIVPERKWHISDSLSCDAVNDRVRNQVRRLFKGVRDYVKKGMPNRGGFRGFFGSHKKPEIDVMKMYDGLMDKKWKSTSPSSDPTVKSKGCGFNSRFNNWAVDAWCEPKVRDSSWYSIGSTRSYACWYDVTVPLAKDQKKCNGKPCHEKEEEKEEGEEEKYEEEKKPCSGKTCHKKVEEKYEEEKKEEKYEEEKKPCSGKTCHKKVEEEKPKYEDYEES